MIVKVTYKDRFGDEIPYTAAVVNTPHAVIEEALEYAFRWTQNIDGSWSNKIGGDANDNVEVCHYLNSGMGLRSSMTGDEFSVEVENGKFKTYECMPAGFREVV